MNTNWLYEYRRNVTSQTGEDGVVEEIFKKIGVTNRWCVDVGAGDGRFISNTWHWINDEEWSGVCIEASSETFSHLQVTYGNREDVFALHELVSETNSIDDLLGKTPIPKVFDLLSIDIDSMDYRIWEKAEVYRARVVIIETNASMAPDIEFIQNDPELAIGSSALAMVKLAKTKGYQLAAHLVSNCIFVLEKDFDKLKIEDNSLEALFTSPFIPKVVSDLRGVHYLLKEGPWGYRETVLANDLAQQIHVSEDGYYSVARSLKQLKEPNVLMTNTGESSGFVSSIHYGRDLQDVLTSFQCRMREYEYPDLEGREPRKEALSRNNPAGVSSPTSRLLSMAWQLGFRPFTWYRGMRKVLFRGND